MPWPRAFEDPITLPDGRTLSTLRDAASYLMALPGKTRQSDEWQAAIEALLMAAENRGPLMHARIGMLRALNRNVERVFNPSRKDTHCGKAQVKEGSMTTVWIYVDTNKEVGDVDHLKVFATPELADEWFKENDPGGVAFEYEVME